MKPYYEDDHVTLYLSRWEDVPADLLRADVLVTDPPYGIGWSRGTNNARNSKPHDGIVNDEDTSSRDAMLEAVGPIPGIVFGSFYAPFPANVRQVLVWQKPADAGLVGSTTGYRRDAEPIFLTGPWPIRTVEWSSVLRTMAGQSGTVSETGHPHTKPVSLLVNLINRTPPGTILDPYAGSGTTLVAAKSLGRKAIGVECVERYAEVAANRLRQEVLGLVA